MSTSTVTAPCSCTQLGPDLADETWTTAHLRRFLHLGRTAIYNVIKTPGFPAPRRVGKDYLWLADDVREWFRSRPASERPTQLQLAPTVSSTLPSDEQLSTVAYAPRRRRAS